MNTYIIIGLALGLVFVLILIKVFYRKEKTSSLRKYQYPGFVLNDPVISSKVKEYLTAEKKIEAIKFVRENTGISLIDAKKFVEEFPADIKTNYDFSTKSDFSQNFSSGKNPIIDEVNQLIKGGNKIQAIKIVVENFNIGLKEAKDFVEAIEANLKLRK